MATQVQDSPEQVDPRAGFAKRFLALFALGMIGIVALLPMIAPAARDQYESVAGELGVSFEIFLTLTLINPTLLLAIGVAVGVKLAPRLGLRSHLDDRVRSGSPVLSSLGPELPFAIALGLAGGATTIILDLLFQSWEGSIGGPDSPEPYNAAALLGGMLYGGISEELMIRWGLLTFLIWAAWWMTGSRGAAPSDGVYWGAIIGSAVAFGAAHLPAMAVAVPLTGLIVARTIFLNALGGLLFGWLFWRRSLESAMIAHATFHIVFGTARMLT